MLGPQDNANFAQLQWQQMFTAIVGNSGVVSGQLNSYVVTTTSGLGISVASGVAMIVGFMARSDAAVPLACAPADPTNPRIDRAVLHADLTAHTLSVLLLTGTPAPSPSPPALTQTATVWEISVCQIRVNATQTVLTAGSLTDERPFSGLVSKGGDTMAGTLVLQPPLGNSFLVASIASTTLDQNGVLDITDLTSGAIHWLVGKQSHTNGDAWRVVDATNNKEGIALLPNAGGIRNPGPFTSVGGQASAGSFGVPVIVAQAIDVNVTATTLQTVLAYSVTTTGIYRVSVHFSHGNTGTTNVTLQVQYADPHLGTPTITFQDANGIFGIFAHGYGINVSVATLPIVMQCKTGTQIQVFYQDASGTPSDFVSVVLERLA